MKEMELKNLEAKTENDMIVAMLTDGCVITYASDEQRKEDKIEKEELLDFSPVEAA